MTEELLKTALKHIDRQDAGITELLARIEKLEAALEAMAREMILSLPGGQMCDPQKVADALREIAERHGVSVE